MIKNTLLFAISGVAITAGVSCSSVPNSNKHSVELLNQSTYTRSELQKLRAFLAPTTSIAVTHAGIVKAADRPLNSKDDPTHYDAVWMRDSLWVYLGLHSQPSTQEQSTKILLRMFDYLSSPQQIERMKRVIAQPSLLQSKDGQMKAVHIRFDANSPDFEDVMINGKAQVWNHKQNDAVGLLLDLVLRAINTGEISTDQETDAHLSALVYLVEYFRKIKFYQMEDAGPWEELERVNSSSIGLVTSALERLNTMLKDPSSDFQTWAQALKGAAQRLGLSKTLEPQTLEALVHKGYERVFKQIRAGGESPLYPVGDPHFRKADAALLNLIYPAKLKRLSFEDKKHILKLIEPLIGEMGIRRYIGDSYQSGNFWMDSVSDKTGNSSSSESFAARGEKFIKGSEAQWFFDSWYSKTAGQLYRESGDVEFQKLQLKFFKRALNQITEGTAEHPVLAADGHPVMPMALPESYNTIVEQGKRHFAPSPITPLNWAKASLLLALDELYKN